MKILITGANGFVGSHITEHLADNGHDVTCLVRNSSSRKWLSNCKLNYAIGDITDPSSLRDPVKNTEAIIHCAGIVRAKRTDDFYLVNQSGTKNLADAVLKYNPSINKFIYISSQAAMGPSKSFVPKTMNDEETPVSDYGKSKLLAERELLILKGRVPYTILRPSAVYGPRDKDIKLYFKFTKYSLLPFTVSKRYLQFVFAPDIAKAVLKCLTSSISDYKTYFLAHSDKYTIYEFGKTISKSIGKAVLPIPVFDFILRISAAIQELISLFTSKPALLNNQKVDEMQQRFWIADTQPAENDLKMDFTNLKIGAKITYSWYKDNKWL